MIRGMVHTAKRRNLKNLLIALLLPVIFVLGV